jgi:GNAT superfamily N-acetyltransferase
MLVCVLSDTYAREKEEYETEMLHVKTMKLPEDLEFALNSAEPMGWGLVKEDFEFMTQLEPDGCFVLFDGPEKIGMATTISYGSVGWLGNVVVDEDRRRQGAGSFLVKQCVRFLLDRGAETIGLYAYVDRVPFYERLGFKSNSEFIFLKGKGFSLPARSKIVRVDKKKVPSIIALDQTCFGAFREKLLKPILLDDSNLCVMTVEGDEVLGYAAATTYDENAELGPLVCSREHGGTALDLLKTVLAKLEGFDVSLCVPKKEASICNMLLDNGLREDFHLMRMFHGKPPTKDCIYLAESLERG